MRALALSLLLAASVAASAQPTRPASGPAVDLLVDLAVEYGGDDVVTLVFTDGDTQTLRAGQGITAAGGVRVAPVPTVPLALHATVGYKAVFNASSNSDLRLTRIPIEVGAAYYVTPDVWLGAGYVMHTATRLHADGLGPDVDFDTAHGATVEAGWRWIGASVTAIGYTDEFGNDYDASSVGVTFRYGFPIR